MLRLPTLKGCKKLFIRHLHFVGPGLVNAVAYIDPGNWATDLQAGAEFGYKLLFMVLIAGLAAVVLQALSVRLGAAKGLSLAHETRSLFLRLEAKHPKHRVLLKICLWSLYISAEVAIIATDLAELVGSAIALNLLFPRLPLYAGVLITSVDVLIVLVFFNSHRGRQGMMLFEILIVSLVLAVFVSFMVLLKLVRPNWGEVFLGFVPSKTLVEPSALYIGIGIVGATVMPHALFLGSHLASVDRLNMLPRMPEPEESYFSSKLKQKLPTLLQRRNRRKTGPVDDPANTEYELDTIEPSPSGRHTPKPDDERGNVETEAEVGKDVYASAPASAPSSSSNPSTTAYDKAVKQYEKDMKAFDRIRWVDIHLRHATIDTVISLLGFALIINSAILILAGASYYYNGNPTPNADINGAFALIKDYVGQGAAIVFALALLCSGQSASITATLGGQVVSEGFIEWRTNPAVRRLVTRLIGVVPSAIVASSVGAQGLNTMLVASQVVLSIILPTVIFPLVYLCSKDDVMTVEGPEEESTSDDRVTSTTQAVTSRSTAVDEDIVPAARDEVPSETIVESEERQVENAPTRRTKSYKSPMWITVLGYLLFVITVLADVYVIVELFLGNAG